MFRTLILLLLSIGSSHAGNENRVLVFGGTGQLGSAVVRELVAAGHPVTVFVRPASDRSRLEGLKLDYVSGSSCTVRSAPGKTSSSFHRPTSAGCVRRWPPRGVQNNC